MLTQRPAADAFLLVLTCLLCPIEIASAQEIALHADQFQAIGGEWTREGSTYSVASSGPAKAILMQTPQARFELQLELCASAESQAGVIFHAAEVSAETDAYRGFYVGIDPKRNVFIWGKSEHRWRSIAARGRRLLEDHWYHLRLQVDHEHVRAWLDERPVINDEYPELDGSDESFRQGQIGLRCLGSGAQFRNISVRNLASTAPAVGYQNPVQENCADPCVLLHNGTYYAYCTYSADHPEMRRGIRMFTSVDLCNWMDRGFVITRERSWGHSRFWAPDVIAHNGRFYLYYAVDTRICAAVADDPGGPFVQLGNGPMLPDSIRIDAHVFRDDDGQMYFYYVAFNDGNEIHGGRMNPDMITVQEDSLRLMIRPDQAWETHRARIVEGPAILKNNGTYYLTYSGSHFESPQYAVGYATSDSPLGPWKKYAHNPVMQSTAYAHGTAHHCFVRSPDQQELFIVYHCHRSLTATEPRQLAIDRVRFHQTDELPDVLEVHGPTVTLQPFPSGRR